ncbi:uncharacterized protein LOC115890130 [Sitophilus oryzae]|uniref:Uncharacterized protein LOC115890130 n=1 Tax=Sitophilus oryzae TaxID=7048 RepID=A0A6J2YTK1_SITOR|nr:uncharacterized protein LOC115890130 [Sitophilus oryzae]
MEEHTLSEFRKLGADEKTSVIALQVLLELCEVKKYWDISYVYKEALKNIIIKARKTKTEAHSTFIPISSYENLSFLKMQEFLDVCDTESAYLAILHPDSTCVYYEISKGLVEPSDTTAKHLRVNKKEKLDMELKKHYKTIEQAALMGISMTLPRAEAGSSQNS